jgi:diguanylate cyclase (GGDEF)-like protein
VVVCDHRGEGLATLTQALAQRGYLLRLTTHLRASLRELGGARRGTLVLLDPLLRAGSLELESVERSRGRAPLLVMVEREDVGALARLAEVLRDGPWDLVPRGANAEEIGLRLDRLRAVSDRDREMDELRHLASHDDRTDLLRPKTFHHRLVEHFSAAKRHRLPLALVLIDLDRFGAINKRHDHTVGDALIERVGGVIRGALRTEDVAGRLGGDEFGVILPLTGKLEAANVVNRLLGEIRRVSAGRGAADEEVRTSASIGFETFDGLDLDAHETLRRHAEVALRAAKRAGGDRGVYFRSPIEEAPGA